jgi:hypothetical protein
MDSPVGDYYIKRYNCHEGTEQKLFDIIARAARRRAKTDSIVGVNRASLPFLVKQRLGRKNRLALTNVPRDTSLLSSWLKSFRRFKTAAINLLMSSAVTSFRISSFVGSFPISSVICLKILFGCHVALSRSSLARPYAEEVKTEGRQKCSNDIYGAVDSFV